MDGLQEAVLGSQYVRVIIPAVLIAFAVYAYRKNKLGAYLVSLIALMMWGLSAFMNMWTGWMTGAVVSSTGSLFGATFMLITEFIVPAALIYKRTTGHGTPMVVVAALVMALGLSVFSFWNGTAMSLNTHFANLMKSGTEAKSISTMIDATKTGEAGMTVTVEKSVQPLIDQVHRLENAPAKNLAGATAFRDGRAMTVKDATYNCTSGVYYTNPKLYKSDCQRIDSLQAQIAKIRKDNQAVVTNSGAVQQLQVERSTLYSQLADEQYKQNTVMPFIDVLVSAMSSGEKCSQSDIACESRKAELVKQTSSTVALYIAVFSEIAKNALVVLAIGLLIPTDVKPVSLGSHLVAVFTLPKRFVRWRKSLAALNIETHAKAKGAREAELKHESEVKAKSRKENILILEAVPWMHSLKFDQLNMVVDFERAMKGKKLPFDEIVMLMLLVCREYDPNSQIAYHKTLKRIKMRSKEDKEYIAGILGEFTIPHEDVVRQIESVTKLNRLSNTVLPALEYAGLVEMKQTADGGNTYFWQSTEVIETGFKKAIKRNQEALT